MRILAFAGEEVDKAERSHRSVKESITSRCLSLQNEAGRELLFSPALAVDVSRFTCIHEPPSR